LARAAGSAATRIYRQELASTGVRAVQNQVEGYAPLLRALASENHAAIREAVTNLVFSHTHIVRLRVISRKGMLTDVGGPYIIAPVAGTLRLHGHSVGRYVLSVQDDLGYVKLESRYVGAPIVLHMGTRRLPIEGTAAITPAGLPAVAPVSYRGSSFEAFSLDARAFPTGSLHVTLLVPTSHVKATTSCDAIAAAELGQIGQRIWARYALASAPSAAYVRAIANLTGGLAYVREGAHLIAGSSRRAPRALPQEGTAQYRGLTYRVSSFPVRVAARTARVYLLFP
jgi:hypothetical protein